MNSLIFYTCHYEIIFVEPAFRKRDIARSLAAAGEKWRKRKVAPKLLQTLNWTTQIANFFIKRLALKLLIILLVILRKLVSRCGRNKKCFTCLLILPKRITEFVG